MNSCVISRKGANEVLSARSRAENCGTDWYRTQPLEPRHHAAAVNENHRSLGHLSETLNTKENLKVKIKNKRKKFL
jgi:hypothetical protein